MMTLRLVVLATLFALAPVAAAQSSLDALDRDLRRLGARVGPAVIRVVASRAVVVDTHRAGDLWTYIAPVDTTTGTGFVVAKDRIVTSSHVVSGARELTVSFADGRQAPARLIGADDFYPVALLEADTGGVEPLAPHADTRPETGALAVIFANTVDGGGAPLLAMTGGTRRARGDFDNYFVVSAPLLPGGSGGPVVAADGRVLGLAHSSFGERYGSSGYGVGGPGADGQGMGAPRVSYCVPAPDLAHAIEQIAEHGRVRRAWLGVSLDGEANRVVEVVEHGPAQAAGLRAGDRVLEIGDTKTPHEAAVIRALARQRPGRTVALVVARAGAEHTLRATLVERPTAPRVDAFDVVPQGVRLTGVSTLSPVHWLRLQNGDVISTINGHSVRAIGQVKDALERMERLEPVRVGVLRRVEAASDEVQTIHVSFGGKFTFAAMPPDWPNGKGAAKKDD